MATDAEKEKMRKTAEFAIGLSDALKRLQKNEDFSKIFQFYFNDEAIRYTHLLGDPEIYKDPALVKGVQYSLIGIAKCAEFMRTIHALAEMQKKTLEELDKEETPGKPVEAEMM